MFHSHSCQGVEADVCLAIHQRASRVEVCCTVVAVTFMVPSVIATHYETFGYFTKFAKDLYSDGNDRKEDRRRSAE